MYLTFGMATCHFLGYCPLQNWNISFCVCGNSDWTKAIESWTPCIIQMNYFTTWGLRFTAVKPIQMTLVPECKTITMSLLVLYYHRFSIFLWMKTILHLVLWRNSVFFLYVLAPAPCIVMSHARRLVIQRGRRDVCVWPMFMRFTLWFPILFVRVHPVSEIKINVAFQFFIYFFFVCLMYD